MTSRDGQEIGRGGPLTDRNVERALGPLAFLAAITRLVPAAEAARREITNDAVSAHRYNL